jgi:hypothetical protein
MAIEPIWPINWGVACGGNETHDRQDGFTWLQTPNLFLIPSRYSPLAQII